MRNRLLFLLLAALVIAGCSKKDESIFSTTPDQRLSATLDSLQSQLINAQYGWVVTLSPRVGGPFKFYMQFLPDNRVKMVSDFDINSANTVKESSWRLKAMQQPTLIFDTYSYLHLYADPNPQVAGGSAGSGYASDFEFAYDPTTAQKDTIKFVGRYNKSGFLLVRATKEEMDDLLSGGFARAFDFHKISALSTYNYQGGTGDFGVGGLIFNYWKRFQVDGKNFEIDEGTFDPTNRRIRFSWYDAAGVRSSLNTTYTFGSNKVIFASPLNTGSTSIKEFTNLKWDDAAKTLTVNVNGTATTTTISGATAPLYYDTTAFAAFRNYSISNNTYWISDFGFFRNGVFNVYGIDTLTTPTATGKATYYYLLYWADYGALSGQRFDLFSPVFLNAAQTGLSLQYAYVAYNNSAANPIVKNGIANLGFGASVTFGSGITTPTTGAWPNTQTLFRSSTGYYFIKLPSGDYDQVAVSDAKSWMTWTP